MKNFSTGRLPQSRRLESGFTLLELMVSTAVFLVIGAAAFSLFSSHAPLFTRQQNISGLNINLRNAVTQMELDVVNAGNGYYPGADIASWPVGLTVNNQQPSTTCYNATAHTYSSTCFDTMNIIGVDGSIPPTHPIPPVNSCGATDTSSILFVDPPPSTEYSGSPSQFASLFHSGDQLLIIKSDGSQMATTTLTQDGSLSGAKVRLQHNPTGASTTDPLGITTFFANSGSADTQNKLGNTFCQSDWVLKLSYTTYYVDATDPTNPKLMRQQSTGTTDVVAEQIIGFKVGASLWSGTVSGDTFTFQNYNYNSYDPSQVRSLIVSLIGRTTPNRTGDLTYKNSFDNGNYQIQSLSVVINPRNLSMNDH